jgi:hypothetical protein
MEVLAKLDVAFATKRGVRVDERICDAGSSTAA